MPNVITALGGVFRALPGDNTGSFLGTCFAYRDSRVILTAAHCVGDLPAAEVVLVWVPGPIIRRAIAIERHSTADIAVITVTALEGPIDCFKEINSYNRLGDDFYAIGCTEVVPPNAPQLPTSRLYKGHFQRFFRYESFLGYKYDAGEISIPAPGGLSGGPIFLPSRQETVIGMVTENVQSALVLDSIEETTAEGKEYKTIYQAIVRFGVVLMLSPVADWVEQRVAKITI